MAGSPDPASNHSLTKVVSIVRTAPPRVHTQRDWGDARSFVRGFHASLQAAAPDDYIFSTGILHSVRDVLEVAFGAVGLNWTDWVKHDTALLRPAEPPPSAGDPSKAERLLGWKNSTPFEELIGEMTRCHLLPPPPNPI
jgi:GDPmannose 4,6-dehydratase